MNMQDRQNLFPEFLARHQSELDGCIFAVVRNRADTDNLFQSLCMNESRGVDERIVLRLVFS